MNALVRLVQPLRSAMAAFFSHDLALRRAEDGVRIVLEERPRPGRPRPPTRAEVTAAKDAQDLALMREQLAALLDELPETRATMRHLVFVEQALKKKGLRTLHKLPLDVLQRALDQLEGLVTNWSPVGLASLRSKMAVAIIDREHMDPDAETDAYNTAAVLEPLQVEPAAAPAVSARSDDEALAAAYAALGDFAVAPVESASDPGPETVAMQGDLGSPSTRALARQALRPLARLAEPVDIELRALQD